MRPCNPFRHAHPNAELDQELHQSTAMNNEQDGLRPENPGGARRTEDEHSLQAPAQDSQLVVDRLIPNPRTRLLQQQDTYCGSSNCNHGTFTPLSAERSENSRAASIVSYNVKNANGPVRDVGGSGEDCEFMGTRLAKRALAKVLRPELFDRQISTTQLLAQKHGINNSWRM